MDNKKDNTLELDGINIDAIFGKSTGTDELSERALEGFAGEGSKDEEEVEDRKTDKENEKGEKEEAKKETTDEKKKKEKVKADEKERDDDEENEGDDDEDKGKNEKGDDQGEEDFPSVVSEIIAASGYKIEDEFEDDVDGMKKAVLAISEKHAEAQFNDLFEQYPDVADFLKYRMNGGDPESYYKASGQKSSLEKMVFGEKDVLVQKDILDKKLRSEGFSEAEINEAISEAEESGTLYSQAIRAQKVLGKIAEKELEALQKQNETRAKQAKIEREEEAKQVMSVINSGKVGDIQIPVSDKRKFFDYLYAPLDSKGTTKADKARAELGIEKALQLEYLIYKGLDLSKLSSTVQSSKKKQSLRDRLKTNAGDTNPKEGFKGNKQSRDEGLPYIPTIQDIQTSN